VKKLILAGTTALLMATGTAHAGCGFFSAPEQPCMPTDPGHPWYRSNNPGTRAININPTTGRIYATEADYKAQRRSKRRR
jgi:hypothetical protein